MTLTRENFVYIACYVKNHLNANLGYSDIRAGKFTIGKSLKTGSLEVYDVERPSFKFVIPLTFKFQKLENDVFVTVLGKDKIKFNASMSIKDMTELLDIAKMSLSNVNCSFQYHL